MTTPSEVDEFRDHQLWAEVADLRARVPQSRPRNPTDRHTLARVEAVLAYVAGYHPISAYLFPSGRVSAADQILRHISQVKDQWEGWDEAAAMLPATVSQIDTSLDSVLQLLVESRWPTLQKESRASAIAESANAFRMSTEGAVAGIEAAVAESQDAVETLEKRIDDLKSEAEARGTQAEASVKLIDDALTEFKGEYAAALEAERAALRESAQEQRSEIAAEAEASLAQLSADAETGQKLVALVGDQSQAGGYERFARREKWGYRMWAGLGGLTVAATLVYLYFEFDALTEGADFDVRTVILKAALSLTALGFSGFCLREAGKRHRQSVEARYRALDLLALRPYTNDMSDTDRTVLRNLLGKRLFGERPDQQPSKSSEKVTTFRLDLADVKSAVDTAKSVKDLAG